MDLLEIQKNKDWDVFSQQDPFNNTLVEGYISHHQGDDYGALFIIKVNGEKVPQLILCTPKIAYPFDKNGNWHFPTAKRIERYEKLDGTNIFAFQYFDYQGNKYASYKTRLTPFIKDSKFGPFLSMWREILQGWDITQFVLRSEVNLSFELWGARNPHLVRYEIPLAASLLFGRKNQKVLPPSFIKDTSMLSIAPFLGVVDKEYVWNYKESQRVLESQLRTEEEGTYLGSEGEVWYLLDESGDWNLYKCKPETIEAIHWSAGGIGKNIIIATIENAFENLDLPTVDEIKKLLAEEFQSTEIEKRHYMIEKLLKEAIELHYFRERVLTEYNTLGLSILTDKAVVMRALSNIFTRTEMKKVYHVIWANVVK